MFPVINKETVILHIAYLLVVLHLENLVHFHLIHTIFLLISWLLFKTSKLNLCSPKTHFFTPGDYLSACATSEGLGVWWCWWWWWLSIDDNNNNGNNMDNKISLIICRLQWDEWSPSFVIMIELALGLQVGERRTNTNLITLQNVQQMKLGYCII